MIDAAQLYKPECWASPQKVHQIFSKLRQDSPIYHCRCDGYPDLWHVTRHQDLVSIENAAEIFLSSPRMTINTLSREESVRRVSGGRPYVIKPLNAMDQPEHRPMREVVQHHFTPGKIKQLKSNVDREAEKSFVRMRELDGMCDFASQIAFQYPLRVVMPILGVPKPDYEFLLRLTKQLFSPADPDNKRPNVDLKVDPARDMKEIHGELYGYFLNLLDLKKRSPSSDLISEIANAMTTVQYMDQDSAIHYCILLATAGHDTTSYSLSEAVYQLALNPNVLARLSDDPQAVSVKIADEAFRLAAPTRHFIRTANQKATISGTTFEKGDSIILWFPSACRDELVCPDPDQLMIDRPFQIPQLAFGSGPHICLGRHLARLELISFLEELGRQVDSVDLVESPKYTESNFVGGIKSLPIKVTWR